MFFLALMGASFFGCGHYGLVQRTNPFQKYQISSISVPSFYNYSNLNNVSRYFTQEFFHLLGQYRGLDIVSAGGEADAYLLGIVTSGRSRKETTREGVKISAKSVAAGDIAGRDDFLIASSTTVRLSLRVLLIRSKVAYQKVLTMMNNRTLNKYLKQMLSSQLVFNQVFHLSDSFAREVFGGESKSVNHTQNSALLTKVLKRQAKSSAEQFNNMILYAF